MRKSDLVAFARRDWQAVADGKERYWAEQMRSMTAEQALQVSCELREHVVDLRPDWPTEHERKDDLENHQKVSERLARVAAFRHR